MISHAATAEHSGTTPDTNASRINHYYLVTWDPKSVANRKAFDERLSEQAGSLLKLWKAGKIENVYLDPKPTDREGKHIPESASSQLRNRPENPRAQVFSYKIP
ncbi:hypothetical protein GCM10023116_44210 [Kistimonas scapharcae]|uniref:Uncharacterized protein n=2 Tax=Kistimonas scapharcae TaxID=1036133 RepID=A0ABP8V8C5_9GAMM